MPAPGMRLVFAPEARQEFLAAELYCNQQVAGLGAAWRDEVMAALRRIRRWPLACPVEHAEIRRLTLSRFPHKLLYAVEADHLYSIAIAHQHRQPDYWTRRVVRVQDGGDLTPARDWLEAH